MNKIILVFLSFAYISCSSASTSAYPVEDIDETTDVQEASTRTQYQQTQLEKFRNAVADLLEDDYERSEEFLLGFLKSKNWKIFSAQQMLRIAKNWKENHNIKQLAKSNYSEEMMTRFPATLEGYDRLGCPIIQGSLGVWNVADYIMKQEFARDGVLSYMKHYWQILAKIDLKNRNTFPKCHQTRMIFTLKNYNAAHLSEVNSISCVVRMLTDYFQYFPGSIFSINFVEVPDEFRPILELVRTILSDDEYSLYTIHDEHNWKKDLLEIVDLDQLTKELGGKASFKNS